MPSLWAQLLRGLCLPSTAFIVYASFPHNFKWLLSLLGVSCPHFPYTIIVIGTFIGSEWFSFAHNIKWLLPLLGVSGAIMWLFVTRGPTMTLIKFHTFFIPFLDLFPIHITKFRTQILLQNTTFTTIKSKGQSRHFQNFIKH